MKRTGLVLLLLLVTFTVTPQTSTNIYLSDFKAQFLEKINTVRERGCKCGISYMRPVAPLVWNDELAASAKGHTIDMARNNYFSHESMDGRTLKDRVVNAGYTYSGYQSFAIGENIAMGQQTIDEVMTGWFKSVGHCKNLMSPNFTEVGIYEYKTYWVQDFGGRISFRDRR